jgi:CBS domain containing-hemolysin-like protein
MILQQFIWALLILVTVWTYREIWQMILSLFILFILYLSLGRVVPRILVQEREVLYIKIVSPVLKALFHLVSPLRILLEKSANFFLRDRGGLENPVIQEKDFINLGPEPEESPEVYEREMLQNVIEFRETLVKEIMTPRPDMFCIEEHEEVTAVIQKVRAGGYSRIPVYSGDRDHIMGILYAKDLLPLLLKGVTSGEELPQGLLHPALHVPETKRVSELLKDFKKQNVHIAMVVDEFGGVEGLICLEDLLEEIVGEIQDEGDVEAEMVEQIDELTYRISAMLPLEDFNDLFDVQIESEDYETIGGFVVDQLGHFPKWGEKVIYHGLEISVYRARGVRILELLVTRLASGGEETDN